MGLQEFVKEKLRLRNDTFLEEDFPPVTEEQSRFLESILDAIEAGVVVDRKGRSRLSNQRGADVVGIRTTGLKPDGRGHDNDVFRPDEKTPFPLNDKPAALALKGEMRDEAGMFIRNPHQPEGVHITATTKHLRDANGDLKGAVTVFTDSRERRRTEELQDAKQKFCRRPRTLSVILPSVTIYHERLEIS